MFLLKIFQITKIKFEEGIVKYELQSRRITELAVSQENFTMHITAME